MVRLGMKTVRLSEPILGLGYEQFVDYDPKYPPTLEHWEILVTTFIADREQLAVEMLPKGWRYLEAGEIIMAGDKELRHYNDWKVVNSPSKKTYCVHDDDLAHLLREMSAEKNSKPLLCPVFFAQV